MKHGHVTPNANGMKARCGGPAICKICKAEQVEVHKANFHNEFQKWSDKFREKGFRVKL